MTIHPQLVNISPEIILILQNMLIYALFIDCRESHLRTFCRQIHQCAKLGGGGRGSILPSRMGERGVSLEHVENMENTEKMENMEMFSSSPTEMFSGSPTEVFSGSPTKVFSGSPTKVFSGSPT